MTMAGYFVLIVHYYFERFTSIQTAAHFLQ